MGPAFSAFSLQPVQEAAEGIFFALRRGGRRGGQCTPDPGQSGPGPGNVCLLAFFIQVRRLTQVPTDACAPLIQPPQAAQSQTVSPLCRVAVQVGGHGGVLRHAAAGLIADAQPHHGLRVSLLGGLLVILVVQVVVMALYAYFVVFRVLGKNYDAAVMCAGLCGHGLGATPSAIVPFDVHSLRTWMPFSSAFIAYGACSLK